MEVSVVIPCFNDGSTLEAAVASAVEGADEVVVVDDGSTDPETVKIMHRVEDRFATVRVIRVAHGGTAAAMQAGVEAARSEAVFFLGADDLAAPEGVRALADALERDHEAVFAYGDYRCFGEHDSLVRCEPWHPWRLLYGNPCSFPLFRRSAYLELGGVDDECGYEDWDLFLRVASRSMRGLYVPVLTSHYRIHGTGRRFRSRSTQRELRLMKSRHADLYARSAQLGRDSGLPVRERAYRRLCWLTLAYLPTPLHWWAIAGTMALLSPGRLVGSIRRAMQARGYRGVEQPTGGRPEDSH